MLKEQSYKMNELILNWLIAEGNMFVFLPFFSP